MSALIDQFNRSFLAEPAISGRSQACRFCRHQPWMGLLVSQGDWQLQYPPSPKGLSLSPDFSLAFVTT